MNSQPFRRPLIAALAAMSLAACQQASGPSGDQQERAQSAPETKAGLALSEGVLMMPVVAGRPAAAYFKLDNGSDKPVSLASAWIEGAESAEIHETRAGSMAKIESLEIGPGDSVLFERGGLHVMAFGLSSDLVSLADAPDGTTEITLTFADGDKLSAPLTIEKMGTAMDMEMDMENAGSGDAN